MTTEFINDAWICPDVADITIENNPPLYQAGNGYSFVLVVNTCPEAENIDSIHGLSTYATSGCGQE